MYQLGATHIYFPASPQKTCIIIIELFTVRVKSINSDYTKPWSENNFGYKQDKKGDEKISYTGFCYRSIRQLFFFVFVWGGYYKKINRIR